MDSLERIASDAASLSVSYTATSSSGTIRGLGSDSGQVIMALGEGTLRVMESLGVEWKLRDTARRVRTTRPSLWSSEDLLDIMEYQRVHLHSRRVRMKAWDVIIAAMERGGWYHILEALLFWPAVETRLFLRQLIFTAETGWYITPCLTVTNLSEEVRQLITDAMSRLLSALLEADYTLVHDILSLSKLLWLFVARPHAPIRDSSPDHLFQDLSAFFDTLSSFDPLPNVRAEWPTSYNTVGVLEAAMMCPSIECLCRFATASPQRDLQHLVNYLLRYLFPGEGRNVASDICQDHPAMTTSVYPPSAFIVTALILSVLSPEACSRFQNTQLPGSLVALCERDPSSYRVWGVELKVSAFDESPRGFAPREHAGRIRALFEVFLRCMKVEAFQSVP